MMLARGDDNLSSAERSAWLDALSADELMIVSTPVGHRVSMIFVAYLKRVLTTETLSTRERLALLEWLDGFVDQFFTETLLATIAPMSDVEYQMFAAAMELGRDGEGGYRAVFDLLGRLGVFEKFAAANPSLQLAVNLKRRREPIAGEQRVV